MLSQTYQWVSMNRQKMALATIIVVVTTSAGAIALPNIQNDSPGDATLNFYVFGDTQGYQGGIEQIATLANQYRPDFVFHCGDLTPFGQEEQYAVVAGALDAFEVPVYTTPGNHDTRLGGGLRYLEYFGPARYSFNIGPAHFTVFNTSAEHISEDDFEWLRNDLSTSDADWKFVFTHIPPFDPRPGHEHTMTNETTAQLLMALFNDYDVNTVFTGHIHMFNVSLHDGVRYVITGGAGASLYANATNGGIHHFVNVTLTTSDLLIEAMPLESPTLPRDSIVVKTLDEDVTLSVDDLLLLDRMEGFSSFQNQYDNWRAYGEYKGVKLADLVELVGGMDPEDILRVSSYDGFSQDFHYSNVYPNASWFSFQGHMIIAFEYNDTLVPSWPDGLRLVMLSPDEGYSNEDCLNTSAPGMGYHVYPSAGARWVRYVSLIEVIKG